MKLLTINNKIMLASSFIIALLFFSGCAKDGSDGGAGQSAYEVWLANGNSGSYQDFLNSLQGDADNVDVTAVDGYIIGATVTDANGNVAFKNGDGTYTFVKTPKYPLSATGGKFKDTGKAFTGTMFTAEGQVVSPITTLVTQLDANGNPLAQVDTTRLTKLKQMMGTNVSDADLVSDYMKSSNEAVGKLAQLAHVLNQDSNLLANFKNSLDTNTDTNGYATAKTLAYGAIDATVSVDSLEAKVFKNILDVVETYNGEVENIEKAIEEQKTLLDGITESNSDLKTLVGQLGNDDTSVSAAMDIFSILGDTDNTKVLTQAQLEAIPVDSAISSNSAQRTFYSSIIKQLSATDVNSQSELQTLATIQKELQNIADGTTSLPASTPTSTNLEKLGFKNIDSSTMTQFRQKLRDFYTNNSNLHPTYAQMQALINEASTALTDAQDKVIAYDTVGGGNAPTESDYSIMTITGITGSNLTTMNTYIANTPADTKNSSAKIQSVSNFINFISLSLPTLSLNDYANLGVSNHVTNSTIVTLANSVLSNKSNSDIDSQTKLSTITTILKKLHDIADATIEPTNGLNVEDIALIGVTGINTTNLYNFLNQLKVQGTSNIDTLTKLQNIANGDLTSPTLTTVTMSSNNTDTTKAGAGKVVTLTIVANENISQPTVTISGRDANISGSGTNYTATLTMQTGDTNSSFIISNVKDSLGNPSSDITTLTSGNLVEIDTTIVPLSTVTIASNDTNTSYADIGKTITLDIISAEDIHTPTVFIAGNNASVTTNSATNYTATFTIDKSTTLGIASITINYTDTFGNTASVTNTTDNSSVTIDSAIKISSAVMSSNNVVGAGYVREGDTITLDFNTTIETNATNPTVTIAGQNANVIRNSAQSFSATYTIKTSDSGGNINISISNYFGTSGEIGLIHTSITSDTLVYDKTAPVISTGNQTTVEGNSTTTTNFFSIVASDANGLRENSYKVSGNGVDDSKITVNNINGLTVLKSQPNYEVQSLYKVQLQVQDNAGNTGYKNVNIYVTDVTEFTIADAIYIKDDNRTGTVQDSFYIIFSERPDTSTLTVGDLSDYEHNLSTSFVNALSNGRYITGANDIGWAHIFDVTAIDINTSQNFTIKIGGTVTSPNIQAVSVVPTEVVYNEPIYGGDVQDLNYATNSLIYKPMVDNDALLVWLDRNLGASQVATHKADATAYGDLYQWGRMADGHQLRNSSTTTTLATDINASNLSDSSQFITTTTNDWVTSGVDVSGEVRLANNEQCPKGYKLPTIDEFNRINRSVDLDGFYNKLKIVVAGRRLTNGIIERVGYYGYYHLYDNSSNTSGFAYVGPDGIAGLGPTELRPEGFSIRCIKD
jgi:hypothetical protein